MKIGMKFNPKDPLLQRQHISNRALIQRYFDLEVEFMVARGYSEQQKLITIRSIAVSWIQKYASDQIDMFVPFLAVTYVDRFLSKNMNIPVVLGDQGFEENLKLFVFCCISIACKIRRSNFLFLEFLNKHKIAEVREVLIMELQILEGLRWKVRPLTAITFMYLLLPLLKNDQQLLPTSFVSQIIVAIQKDVRFTEYRPSSLAASAILVTSYKLLPGLHSKFFRNILGSGFVKQYEVKLCFKELKQHVIPDSILNPGKRSRVVLKEKHRWGFKQEKGKEPLIENSPVDYKADQFEITSEITQLEDDPEEIIIRFDLNWQEPKHEPEPIEDERYNPILRILCCNWPMAVKCFGY